ncbi:MAG: hypothetical protein BGO42_12850 [Flavobacterium sp. 40-81]|nr:MAG: hypothetical protein ABS44_13860 [Chryseobacterium sp. SCN 40-13]OJV69264.1 MAG: hypothetical protein BGO42_12850 [Flavobacterium sp. 40-81]
MTVIKIQIGPEVITTIRSGYQNIGKSIAVDICKGNGTVLNIDNGRCFLNNEFLSLQGIDYKRK